MMKKKCWIAYALLLSIISVLLIFPKQEAKASQNPKPPNILFCIADDWSWPHASIYGDPVVSTPVFDRVARQGAVFTHAFVAAPSCTPSRAAIVTGMMPHQLEEGANLWGFLPEQYPNYVDILEQNGYAVGMTRKGWGPGNYEAGGYTRNPAGPAYESFQAFFSQLPANKPFCFWFGSQDPHRPYEAGTGQQLGMDPAKVEVPAWLPYAPEVRQDILDYYYEIERFDREVGEILHLLEESGQMENTIVVITGDNGMPFPRAKANLYDGGTHVPLAMQWLAGFEGGKTITQLVSLVDLTPTFLSAAGLQPDKAMVGHSLLPLLKGKTEDYAREQVFMERERHANVREGNIGYPARAVRTQDYLYIRNFRPERWPAGDPDKPNRPYGDVDDSPTKQYILDNKEESAVAAYFDLSFAKRPAEELYDLQADPAQMRNIAGEQKYDEVLEELRHQLQDWMQETQDPRLYGGGDEIDKYPYYGRKSKR